MKTILRNRLFPFILLLAVLVPGFSNVAHGQNYTTVANGVWNLPTTWKNGVVPPAGNIAAGAVINVKHIVTYVGGSITNNGTLNITNGNAVSARLILPGGIDITNKSGGKINIINAELRQYRYVGGLELLGLPQSGKLKNDGGSIQALNSFIEIAQDWSNESNGVVSFRNSSLAIGRRYELKNSARDTIEYTSISIGVHGSGDYIAEGHSTWFHGARIQVASPSGRFELKSGIANGSIDHIVLKNHVNNNYSSDKITANSGLVTTGGLTLGSYCIGNASNYQPNGKFSGPQVNDCSANYFPAGLMGSAANASFNFSNTPSLVAGTALKAGAEYRYEGVAPGVDALVKIDSLVNGATVAKLDDNTGGLGYIEGFQPEIKAGSASGQSYAVFTIAYRVSGTTKPYIMNTFSVTALDIDGNGSLKEFDEINMGPGSTADYMASRNSISVTQPAPGVFRATHMDANERDGIDTTMKENMLTVTNTNISSFQVKLGMEKSNSSQPNRQFGIYMKGFVYPSLATLPVKMEYFTAIPDAGFTTATLKWVTSAEKNVSHFLVEKSDDGRNFREVGLVFATGNSSERITYSFNDKLDNVSKPVVVYYRIRSVDNDGSNELSYVRTIRIGNKQEATLSILAFPNPVVNEVRVTIPGSWQGKQVSYEIYNQSGQSLVKRIATAGSQTEAFDLTSLNRGIYIVRATCAGDMAQQKIVKH